MKILEFLVDSGIFEVNNPWLLLIFSIAVYIILRRHIQKVFSRISCWQKETTETQRREKNTRMVKMMIYSLSGESIEVISNTIKTIIAMEEMAVEPLIGALRHSDPKVRWVAAKSLGEINDPRAIEPLISASGDSDSFIRLTITAILADINDTRVIEPLIFRLNDEDKLVAAAALRPFAEGKLKHAQSVAPLIKFLESKDNNTRKDAVKALGKIGNARAVPALIKLLNDRDWTIQEQTIWALKDIGDRRAVEPLTYLLNHEVLYIRTETARALAKIGDKTAIPQLEEAISDEDNLEVKNSLRTALKELNQK